MIGRLQRIVQSRVIGFILVATLAFSVVSLARNWLVRRAPASDANIVEIPRPNLEKTEAIVRKHLDLVQRRFDEIVASPASMAAQRGRRLRRAWQGLPGVSLFGSRRGVFPERRDPRARPVPMAVLPGPRRGKGRAERRGHGPHGRRTQADGSRRDRHAGRRAGRAVHAGRPGNPP